MTALVSLTITNANATQTKWGEWGMVMQHGVIVGEARTGSIWNAGGLTTFMEFRNTSTQVLSVTLYMSFNGEPRYEEDADVQPGAVERCTDYWDPNVNSGTVGGKVVVN